MKIAITGGAGFIGSCMLWKLNQKGIDSIYVVDELDTSEKWKNLVGKRFEDYFDKNDFLEAVCSGILDDSVDVIIHFGACSSTTETNASYLMDNNYQYSKVLAEWALKKKKRFLYASSAATYGAGEQGYSDSDTRTPDLKPLNMYGYSKQAFDMWVLKNNLQSVFVGFKFFNVYGPNEYHKADMRSMVHKGYQQIKATGKIRLFKSHKAEYTDGEQKRDFIYVKDAVEIVDFFLENPGASGIVNVGTGKAHSWNDLAHAIFKALGLKPKIDYFDMPAVLRDKYQYFTQADMSKLRSLGYTRDHLIFDDAIKEYVTILETTEYL
jgi:ADP-L-glycero-D-manno-heptose 6-epimerase